jgi:hypothetical protein
MVYSTYNGNYDSYARDPKIVSLYQNRQNAVFNKYFLDLNLAGGSRKQKNKKQTGGGGEISSITGMEQIIEKINDDRYIDSSKQVIDNLYNKIMEIDDIKRSVGDFNALKKSASKQAEIIQNIIFFTMFVLNSLFEKTTNDSDAAVSDATIKVKMIKYLEIDDLVEKNKKIKIILNSDKIDEPSYKIIKGTLIRTSNFLDKLEDCSKQVVTPNYVEIDIKSKTFIPLLITQAIMYYDFDT